MSLRSVFAAAVLALSLCACADKTAIVVEIRSMLAVPADVDQIEIRAVGAESGAMLTDLVTIDSPFPHTYTILPGRSDGSEQVTITVVALRRATPDVERGTPVAEATVVAEFRSGETQHVVVELGEPMPPEDGGVDGGPPPPPPDAEVDAGCTSAAACDDGVACTRDGCIDGVCTNTPDDALCEAGSTCDPTTGCPARTCADSAECTDSLVCNGEETCTGGACVAGPPLACDDGIACTADSCDDAMGGCVATPSDTLCDDGNACNGVEACDPAVGCMPGAPLECGDGDPCTDDRCGGMPGACIYTTRDSDGDGSGDLACMMSGGVPATDCDDGNPDIEPGAPEICNGLDDNCDSACDETFTCCRGETGSCTTSCGSTGTRVCSASCGWSVCAPPSEICNGADDDCNGACDDGFGCCQGTTSSCTTSCGTTGTRTCSSSCTQGACTPPAETCDGVDQDCDSMIDEGCGGPCTVDADCDDRRPCNGTETCYRGGCSPGVPPSCDDGVRCTIDSCSDMRGGCVHTPDNAFCNDGNYCNGAETCNAVAGCTAGVPPSCSDSNACTEDSCIGTTPGMCTNTTRDADDDGYGDTACAASGGVPNTDCDDTRATVNPGAPELCNGRDDDCDTSCDETFTCCRGTTGSCTTSCGSTGTRVCTTTCSWDTCAPPAETCNGRDDDCNGVADDGFTCRAGSTGSCTTTCGSTGSRTCSSTCGWGSCTAPAETCNGADDDCDGIVDDGFTCAVGATSSCTTTCGSTGTRSCTTSCGWGMCTPPAEACNGMDDDCDGMVDETVECSAGAMGACTTSCGSTGTRTCSSACTWGMCMPPVETCNGTDDDCDGMADDGFTCRAGSTGTCMTSCGSTGSRTCSAACAWGTCTAPAEVCNGADDDCDGMVDDGFTCVPGTTGTCTTSCGTSGTRTCTSSCTWGACTPPSEVCNAADDDCDANVDETFSCVRGATGACTTSCGSTGTRTCSTSCAWGTCAPPAETCNGLDDDCDTMPDDGFTCAVGTVGSCTTSCGTTGSRTCSSMCTWNACSAPAETCNGVDDDCNGACDDSFACCRGTTGSCTTSCGSTGTRTCSSTCGWGTCMNPAETCNGADDDCDGLRDEGFTCIRDTTESCTTSCGSTGTRTCGASCSWGACAPPAETCNGRDDDCDGMSDEGCGGCASCSGAVSVTGTGGRYDVSLVPHSQTGSCGGSGSEAYLTFTLTATSDVFLTTHASGIDTVLYVRNCTCTGTERACNDNADGRTSSMLRLTSLPAGTYNVVVDTRASMSAMVPVDVYITAPGSESDRCGNPTPIAAGATTLTGNTCGYTSDYEPIADGTSCFAASGDELDRVYYFYVPTTRTVTFNGCESGMNYDSTIFIRRVCNETASASQIGCNDDGAACTGNRNFCNTGRYNSSLTVTLSPGLYYFFADGYLGSSSVCGCGPYSYAITGL